MKVDLQTLVNHVTIKAPAAQAMSPEAATATIMELIEALQSHPDLESSDDACFALGYCWYSLPGNNPDHNDNAEKWLRKAVSLDVDHHDARLLLGHHLYDQDCFRAAKEQFMAIPAWHFSREGQKWRDLKIRELVVCCDIYRYPDSLSMALIGPVFQDYLQGTVADAEPQELIEAIAWTTYGVNLTPAMLRAYKACLDLLARLELEKKFAAEVKLLREALAKANAAAELGDAAEETPAFPLFSMVVRRKKD